MIKNFTLISFVDFVSRKMYGNTFKPYDVSVKELDYDTGGEFIHYLKKNGIPKGVHGECEIIIDRCLLDDFISGKDIYTFVAVIIHEVTHYNLWWNGIPYDDDTIEFQRKAIEIGFYDNYGIVTKLNTDFIDEILREYNISRINCDENSLQVS